MTTKENIMRHAEIFCLLLLTVSCGSTETAGPVVEQVASGAVREPFRDQCLFFESLDFGHRTTARLFGKTWLRNGQELKALVGVQLAAREVSTGLISYALTGPDGEFTVAPLRRGEYEVWTCIDGYDEIRFMLSINPESSVTGLDIYLAPSELSGHQAVVARYSQDGDP